MGSRIEAKCAAFVVAMLTAPAIATEPVEFSTFDPVPYCDSIDRGAAKVKPVQIEEILSQDDPGRSFNGLEIADAVLIGGAIDVAHASVDANACRATLEQGRDLFETVYGSALDSVKREKRHRYKKKEPIRSIQQNIARLWQQDQAGRFAFLSLKTEDRSGAKFWAQRLSVANSKTIDERSKRYMESILADFDWIDRARFGRTISDHAWILVQHADGYPRVPDRRARANGALCRKWRSSAKALRLSL